jgi:hypothetical protein
VLARLAPEELGQRAQRAAICQPRGDVRPLARVGALGEQAAELVERPGRGDDPVRVMVDERDLAQYLRKWWCQGD